MSQEKLIVNYIFNNPNCTWKDVKQKFGSKARKEVFFAAKDELQKRKQERKQKNILQTLRQIHKSKDPWCSLGEFCSACE